MNLIMKMFLVMTNVLLAFNPSNIFINGENDYDIMTRPFKTIYNLLALDSLDDRYASFQLLLLLGSTLLSFHVFAYLIGFADSYWLS